MLSTSPSFLFVFLPGVLTLYWLLPGVRLRNALLLVSGLAFYAWGQGAWTAVLVLCVLSTYILSLWLERGRGRPRRGWALAFAVAVVLAPLALVKYAAFGVQTINDITRWAGGSALDVPSWPAPAGISFFTFMALTYLFSVARGESGAQRSILPVALYTSLFPVVLAGPIIRYGAALPQLLQRRLGLADAADGARRFVRGLAKKALVADTLATPSALIFGLPYYDLSQGVAWFGLVCYTLQIFIDFSAYSDMAIGIGGMLGLRVPENFDSPYTARSIREFWARWHVTLSTWFRDYVFIRILYPAGRLFERMGARAARSDFWAYAAASLTTMLLIGLWHGAAWTFVAWGLYHGALLVLERTRAGTWIGRTPGPVQHAYLVLAVMGGWVLFRLDTLRQAGWFLAVLAGLTGGGGAPIARYAGGDVLVAAAVGIVLSTRLAQATGARARAWLQRATATAPVVLVVGDAAMQAALLLLSLAWLSAGTYTPFIYFRF
jgi:alginate O-acetyltransferase complex protein AlgI